MKDYWKCFLTMQSLVSSTGGLGEEEGQLLDKRPAVLEIGDMSAFGLMEDHTVLTD